LPTEGNLHLVVRLNPVLRAGLKAYALAKGMSVSQLVRRVLMDFAHEVAATQRGVAATLDRIRALVDTLEVQVYSLRVAGIETQKQREEPYDTAFALVKEAARLAQTEEAPRTLVLGWTRSVSPSRPAAPPSSTSAGTTTVTLRPSWTS